MPKTSVSVQTDILTRDCIPLRLLPLVFLEMHNKQHILGSCSEQPQKDAVLLFIELISQKKDVENKNKKQMADIKTRGRCHDFHQSSCICNCSCLPYVCSACNAKPKVHRGIILQRILLILVLTIEQPVVTQHIKTLPSEAALSKAGSGQEVMFYQRRSAQDCCSRMGRKKHHSCEALPDLIYVALFM